MKTKFPFLLLIAFCSFSINAQVVKDTIAAPTDSIALKQVELQKAKEKAEDNQQKMKEAQRLARLGSYAGNGSGDIFVAFSTANENSWASPEATITMLSNDRLDQLFTATVHATEAAITNAMLAAETMTGANGVRVHELPVGQMMEVMRVHNRVPETDN